MSSLVPASIQYGFSPYLPCTWGIVDFAFDVSLCSRQYLLHTSFLKFVSKTNRTVGCPIHTFPLSECTNNISVFLNLWYVIFFNHLLISFYHCINCWAGICYSTSKIQVLYDTIYIRLCFLSFYAYVHISLH